MIFGKKTIKLRDLKKVKLNREKMKLVESSSTEIKLILGWGTLEMGRQMSAGGAGEWDGPLEEGGSVFSGERYRL